MKPPAPDRGAPHADAGMPAGHEPPIRLMVVDDHTLFRRGLVALLATDERFEVVGEAGDAAQALQWLAAAGERRPHVLLLDNHLPGVSGVAALPSLLAAAPGLRVLMLTVSEDEHDLAAALKGGACGYLLKTVDSDELGASIVRAAAGQSSISPTMTAKVASAFRLAGEATAPEGAPGAPGAPVAAAEAGAGGRGRARRDGARAPVAASVAFGARARDARAHRARRQQQGDRTRPRHRRGDGEDPRAAHPAQARPRLAGAGGGVAVRAARCGRAGAALRRASRQRRRLRPRASVP
jgi:two-component system, NarL family, nitrate/nitrite response regulator NarL